MPQQPLLHHSYCVLPGFCEFEIMGPCGKELDIYIFSPTDCDIIEIRNQVERLASLMAESTSHVFLSMKYHLVGLLVPGKRYATTLQLMLKRSKKRKAGSTSRSPKTSREPQRSLAMVVDLSTSNLPPPVPVSQHRNESFSPGYDIPLSNADSQMQGPAMPATVIPHQHLQTQQHPNNPDAEQIWRGFEMTSTEQLPVWISDQSLGGNSFSQHGMDAFLLPSDYLPSAPQIW